MAYSVTGPQKLEKIKSFFTKQGAPPNEAICLDIGGNSDTEKFIQELFPRLTIHTLNNYRGHQKGVSNPHSFDAENGKIPFKSNSISTIFLLDIIEHLIEPTAILDECVRVLGKDGVVVISTPNLATIYNRFFLLFGWPFSNYHTCQYKVGNPFLHINPGKLWNENLHKSVFTYTELKQLIEKKYGLKIIHIGGFSYADLQSNASDSSYGLVRRFFTMLLPPSLQEGILIIAKK